MLKEIYYKRTIFLPYFCLMKSLVDFNSLVTYDLKMLSNRSQGSKYHKLFLDLKPFVPKW